MEYDLLFIKNTTIILLSIFAAALTILYFTDSIKTLTNLFDEKEVE